MSVLLLQLEGVCQGVVAKRPSQYCKTPYVADVLLENGEEIMGHSLSLGCCGLADKGSNVIMTKTVSTSNKKQVCSHRIDLAIYTEPSADIQLAQPSADNQTQLAQPSADIQLAQPSADIREVIIGINPKLGENIAEEALKKNCIHNLINVKSYTREVKIMNSRFDFAGIDADGKPFILEIKNVPLADYVDVPKKERKHYIDKIKNKGFNEKIAYFPDGYRKNSTDVVSPRALKHIQELEEIAKNGTVRAILCFIVQRNDVKHFQTSNVDLVYKKAVYQAYQNGVEIKTIQVEWNKQGECYFIRNDLPILLTPTKKEE